MERGRRAPLLAAASLGRTTGPCLATIPCSPPCFLSLPPSSLGTPSHPAGRLRSCRSSLPHASSLQCLTLVSFLFFFLSMALPFFFFFLTRSAVATFPVVSPVPYFFVKLGLSTAVPPACWFRARYVSEVCDRVTCAGYVYVCVCVNCVSRCFQSALFLCLLPRPVMFAVVRSTFFFVRVQLSFELFPPVTSSSPQSCLRRLIVSYLGSLFANVAGCTVLQRCATTTVSLAGGTSDGRKRQCAHCSADQTKGIRPVHLLTLGMLRVGRTLLPAGFATQAPQAHGEKLALASPVRKNVNFPHLYFFFV